MPRHLKIGHQMTRRATSLLALLLLAAPLTAGCSGSEAEPVATPSQTQAAPAATEPTTEDLAAAYQEWNREVAPGITGLSDALVAGNAAREKAKDSAGFNDAAAGLQAALDDLGATRASFEEAVNGAPDALVDADADRVQAVQEAGVTAFDDAQATLQLWLDAVSTTSTDKLAEGNAKLEDAAASMGTLSGAIVELNATYCPDGSCGATSMTQQ
jgi:hypothetical protein